MIRLNKLTDYALLITDSLARQAQGRRCNMAEITEQTGLALATVRKILKKLVDGGVVRSYRGTQGGYCLAGPADQISVVQVISAIEGPLAITECNLDKGCCAIEESCRLRDNWHHINLRVMQMLESIPLSDLAKRPVNIT